MARSADSLRRYLDALVGTLDESVRSSDLARREYISRFHFDHLVRAGVGEPAALRRRLLLERAAYVLGHDRATITEIAFDASYESPGAFSRAFSRAFGGPPTAYRRRGATAYWLAAPNGIHFHPPSGLLVTTVAPKETGMDLVDRLIGHDLWLTGRLLNRAASLSGEELDRPLELADAEVPLVAETTLRRLLNRLVFEKEMWTAAIVGRSFRENPDQSVAAMRRRLAAISDEFRAVVQGIRSASRWNDTFIDTTCDPPEAFTFGGAVAHVVTFSAYRRELVIGALRRAGVTDLGLGDPIEWERAQAEA